MISKGVVFYRIQYMMRGNLNTSMPMLENSIKTYDKDKEIINWKVLLILYFQVFQEIILENTVTTSENLDERGSKHEKY